MRADGTVRGAPQSTCSSRAATPVPHPWHSIAKGSCMLPGQEAVEPITAAPTWPRPAGWLVDARKTEILIYEPTLTHAVAVGADGSVHVVASTLDGRLMYRRSDDGGANWNAPVTLVGRDGPRDGVGVDLPRVAVDPSGRVHVVWGDYVFPAGWPPLGVWYMRSVDRGTTWQDAQNIDPGLYGMINVAVNGSDTVHLLWHGTAGGTHDRKYRRSVNGGLSWDPTEQVVPSLSGGFNGVSGVDCDSAGTPHIATCMDTTPFLGTVGAAYHVARERGRWAEPIAVSRNAKGQRSVEYPWIAVGLGNQLHMVWEDDFQRVMYTTRTVDAPPIAARALPPPPRPASLTVPTPPSLTQTEQRPPVVATRYPQRQRIQSGLTPTTSRRHTPCSSALSQRP